MTSSQPSQPQPGNLAEVHALLLAWYDRNGRDLPWRGAKDPYAILVSEVMLQQTQVDRVIPKYAEFLERFPTFKALAEAPTAAVIRAWSPLGYNRRAVRLQAVAARVADHLHGRLPDDVKTLRGLPGIGEYTASALACFVHGQDVPVVDTNVRRVLGRVFRGPLPLSPVDSQAIAAWALPRGRASRWSQALMDLGAALCTSRRPACARCPLERHCLASAQFKLTPAVAETRAQYRPRQKPFAGSPRFYRGRVVEHLRHLPTGAAVSVDDLGPAIRDGYSDAHRDWLLALLRGLEADGLAVLHEALGEAVEPTRVSLP